MAYIRDTINALILQANEERETIRYVVLEMSPVISIDSSAVHILADMAKEFKKRGLQLAFANTGNRVEKLFDLSSFTKEHGKEWFHSSTAAAVEQCLRHRSLNKNRHNIEPVSEEEEEAKQDVV
eukprot:CAMPEP_0170180818 /NCGR_PEP_ID=MMETSP0040_2-20121228/23114_1 /TAXON_ID=641309 /ORGANISM="Lotharella oceanica, Strain CCMP622" /LENGTH=123 /DNA_ID=CAMNT_0010425595 /DNA_START=33 /DNA_END=404 /DNA_ORIENTATION=+